MVHYRRNYLSGGTFFFTVTLRDRGAATLVDYIGPLRQAVRVTHQQRPFTIDAMVVLPEHIHALWTLPAGDSDYAGRWRAIKSHFTRALLKQGIQLSRNARGEYKLWQRRYWEHTIRDEQDLKHHLDYIHYNPVKHRLVNTVYEWPYSSFHRFVRQGVYPHDWAGLGDALDSGDYGEQKSHTDP